MVIFPNCKINLGLRILRKRTDGYHDLETVFYPLPWKDVVEVITATGSPKENVQFHASGLTVAGNQSDNLCIKAYNLLKPKFPDLPPIQLYLHKAIPMGAGLGGGSADGAFTLRLLNDKYQLGLSATELIELALQLGSDCPFFILNTPCFATGRGEIMEPVSCNLAGYKILLINPGIHINTGWAFSQLNLSTPPSVSLKEIIQQPVETWKDQLLNDFEKPVFELHPEIRAIKEKMYSNGAVYAAMSGSGSTVFGLFKEVPEIEFPSEYIIKVLSL